MVFQKREPDDRRLFINKVHRQHNSLVITLPYLLVRDLGIAAGDYVSFRHCEGDKSAQFELERKGVTYGVQSRRSRGRENQGG